jgi:tRNA(fMet)-specific endonuclease VapC
MTNSGADSIDRLVLDTSAYALMRAEDEGVMAMVAAAKVVILPVAVIGELEGGFAIGSRTAENRMALGEFLAEPFVSVLDATQSVARRYGEVWAMLRRAGTPIPTNDIWIAAATLDCGGRLLTFDAHFERISGLARARPLSDEVR